MNSREAVVVLKRELDGIPSDIDKSEFEQAVKLAVKALEVVEKIKRAGIGRCDDEIGDYVFDILCDAYGTEKDRESWITEAMKNE